MILVVVWYVLNVELKLKKILVFVHIVGGKLEKNNDNSSLRLILSLINLVFVMPSVLINFGIWSIFGAFSNNAVLYYGLLGLGALYVIASLVFLISSIGRLIRPKNSEKTVISEIIRILVIITSVVVTVAIITALIKYF